MLGARICPGWKGRPVQPTTSWRMTRHDTRLRTSKKRDSRLSESSADKENDYLYQLGQSDLNLNIDTGQSLHSGMRHESEKCDGWTSGQNMEHLDSLFTGDFLGHKSDIADGTLRNYELRSFGNIVGDYYVAPRFMERVAV